MSALVFVDANVLKFASTELQRFVPRQVSLQWGPTTVATTVHDPVLINPNEGIASADLRKEADLLPQIAACGKSGTLKFVQTVEALYEEWGLPDLDTDTGRFYGAPLHLLRDVPFKYSRIMGGSGIDGRQEQLRFLASVNDKRFIELQRACGAFQGHIKPPNHNQLLDAFHIWCAEVAGCSYFLTLDFKLMRVLSKSKAKTQLRLVRPSELLFEVQRNGEQ